MKRNVSIPRACEMENEGLEVTAEGAGARYGSSVEQCRAHGRPSKTFDLKSRAGKGLVAVPALCSGGGGGRWELCFEIDFEEEKRLINVEM